MESSHWINNKNKFKKNGNIQDLIYKMGYEGYGLYWALIESMYYNDGYIRNSNKKYKVIGYWLHVSSDKIKRIVNDFDLFKFKNGKFYSKWLLYELNKRGSTKYIKWKKNVLSRDDHKCKNCGSENNLHVHHIKSYKKHPELRTDMDNGITLCSKCHIKEHKKEE